MAEAYEVRETSFNTEDGYHQDGNSQHPPKRQRILACKRCRHRKQKCDGDGESPCTNCRRANEECEPTEPTLMRARYKADYVQSLEQRLAQLERLIPPASTASGEDGRHTQQDERPREVLPVRNPTEPAPIHIQTNETFRSQPVETNSSTMQSHESGASPAHTHHSHSTHASVSRGSGSPAYTFQTGPGHTRPIRRDSNITGVMASLPFGVRQHNQEPLPAPLEHYLNQLAIWPDALPPQVEDHLINVYFDNANRRWPFLLKDTLYSWHACWKRRPPEGHDPDLWQGFFVNMLFAVSILLDPKNPLSMSYTSQNFYDQAVNNYLPAVLRHPSRLLHVQAYLMMSIHALFSPSTEQISLMISSAMRYCVVARFHLIESEPEPIDSATRTEIQMRRRAFWVAYGLDRLACGVLRLPFSISDDNITVPLFDNMDNSAILDGSFTIKDDITHTDVSSALHRERCFQIQSEILNVTMRADFAMNFDSLSDWRSYILAKLDHWKSQLQQAADSGTKGATDERWILIVYNHCLLYLHIPTKSNVRGPAGDWSVQASTQTILIFRKYQGYRTVPHPMLGLISQFSIGTTILYCLWATPPKFRTDSYNSKNVFEAIRACSNNLAIITERWESTKDLSDIFELLATEIPLAESVSSTSSYGERATKRISDEAAQEIRSKLPNVKSLVLNRETIRMIEEMITEDFPREHDAALDASSASASYQTGIGDKLDHLSATAGVLPMSTQTTFFTNSLQLHQFPSPYLSGDNSANHLGALSPGQTLEFPGSLSGYDMF